MEKNRASRPVLAFKFAFVIKQMDIIHTINGLRMIVMRNLVLAWFIFINIYGSISLVNVVSTSYMDGSRLPWLLAIPILCLTNFIAGRMMTKSW